MKGEESDLPVIYTVESLVSVQPSIRESLFDTDR
jgi:hypothetical protein